MKNITLDIDPMRESAAEATTVLQNLANANRLLLLCQLTQGERSVGELEDLLDIHQPTLSQQLGVLRTDGLVSTRRDGKQIYYSLADERVRVLLTTIYKLYCTTK
ncbi:metalloregulator ArsR/SmtB family transcription factor [Lacisediminimonas sp.]|uniref:ArsR/SmtB family transcription factor n=1 Tax=Lacisediminimonas sp. TaxID=3060582 RepID=UPI00271FB6CA|nr:metalloregulator ArsR/SmtB family transcription factor [Lacisediminimonas sp.]MDO8299512.1 metalloregulator ArsR/SmtB family transcription factor [Lacisediminimonas sp.]MDO9216966.1 metalloregulator ArsR/SmtB family transcription factor [Lacisediminimonas sp.]